MQNLKKIAITLVVIIFSNTLICYDLYSQKLETLMDSAIKVSRNNPEEAIKIFEKVSKLSERDEDGEIHLKALIKLSDNFSKTLQFEQSMKYCLSSQEQVIKLIIENDLDSTLYFEDIGWIYNRFGLLLFQKEDYTKAEECLQTSLYAFKKAKKEDNEGIAYNNLGLIEFNRNNLTKSLNYNRKALEISIKLNDKYAISRSNNNLGILFTRMEEYDSASVHLQKALFSEKCENEKWFKAEVLNNIGEVNIFLKNYDSAIKTLEQAASIAENINAIDLLKDNSAYSMRIYEKLHDYEKALTYYRKHKNYSNQLLSEEHGQKIADYYEVYQIKERENEIKLIENEEKLIQLRMWFIIFALLFILIIIVWIFLFLKTRSRKRVLLIEKSKELLIVEQKLQEEENKRLNSEINYKMRELTTVALHLSNRNEFITFIKEKIKDLRTNSSVKNRNRITKLLAEINSMSQITKELSNLNKEVDKYNIKFLQILEERYPKLTEKDRRTCTFLRMGLASKEISTLCHIEINSVIQNRYRLRKKLDLNKNDDLVKFLKDLY